MPYNSMASQEPGEGKSLSSGCICDSPDPTATCIVGGMYRTRPANSLILTRIADEARVEINRRHGRRQRLHVGDGRLVERRCHSHLSHFSLNRRRSALNHSTRLRAGPIPRTAAPALLSLLGLSLELYSREPIESVYELLDHKHITMTQNLR
jgi:hypothetical protein